MNKLSTKRITLSALAVGVVGAMGALPVEATGFSVLGSGAEVRSHLTGGQLLVSGESYAKGGEAKCGEGKCGEKDSGEAKCGEGKDGEKDAGEAKCGEGKCGGK